MFSILKYLNANYLKLQYLCLKKSILMLILKFWMRDHFVLNSPPPLEIYVWFYTVFSFHFAFTFKLHIFMSGYNITHYIQWVVFKMEVYILTGFTYDCHQTFFHRLMIYILVNNFSLPSTLLWLLLCLRWLWMMTFNDNFFLFPVGILRVGLSLFPDKNIMLCHA